MWFEGGATAENLFPPGTYHISLPCKLIWSKYQKLKLFSTRSNVENCFGYRLKVQQESG